MEGKSRTVGAYSGLTAGAVSAGIMGLTGTLPMLGKDPGQDPTPLDFVIHTVISVGFGAGFAAFFGRRTRRYSRSLLWGLFFGFLLWVVGPMTLLPIFRGLGIGTHWNAEGLTALTPSLVCHLIYGVILGTFYVAFKIRDAQTLIIGAYSGLTAGVVSAGGMGITGTLPMVGKGLGQAPVPFDFVIHLLVSIGFGTAFAMAFERRIQGYAGALLRGCLFGTFLWFVGPLTLLPTFLGATLGSSWNAETVRRLFPSLVGHLVYGSVLGAFYLAIRRSSFPKADAPVP